MTYETNQTRYQSRIIFTMNSIEDRQDDDLLGYSKDAIEYTKRDAIFIAFSYNHPRY